MIICHNMFIFFRFIDMFCFRVDNTDRLFFENEDMHFGSAHLSDMRQYKENLCMSLGSSRLF